MPAVGGIPLEGIHWWVKISRILNLLHLEDYIYILHLHLFSITLETFMWYYVKFLSLNK